VLLLVSEKFDICIANRLLDPVSSFAYLYVDEKLAIVVSVNLIAYTKLNFQYKS